MIARYKNSNQTDGLDITSDNKTILFADGTNGVISIDISNPSNPILLDTFTAISTARDVRISSDDQYAFVANGMNGLFIIDMSDKSNLTFSGSWYAATDTAYHLELSSDDLTVYLAHGLGGLVIIDVANPSAPTLIGSHSDGGLVRESGRK